MLTSATLSDESKQMDGDCDSADGLVRHHLPDDQSIDFCDGGGVNNRGPSLLTNALGDPDRSQQPTRSSHYSPRNGSER
jgi:hypothetical protein